MAEPADTPPVAAGIFSRITMAAAFTFKVTAKDPGPDVDTLEKWLEWRIREDQRMLAALDVELAQLDLLFDDDASIN
jgi:hypothetical protein